MCHRTRILDLTIWQSDYLSVIKGCARGEQRSLSGVSRFPSREFFCNCTSRTTALSFGTADLRLTAIGR